jgi:hypothetical protein
MTIQLNRKYSSAGAVVLTVSALAAGCSALSVKKPEPKTLVVNEQPAGTGFSLSGETPSGLYRGGLLIWSPEVKAQQIETLLRATRETNEKYVALNRYFTSFREKEVEPLQKSLEQKKVRFAQLKSESDARLSAVQAQKASVWNEQETAEIKRRFPSFDVARNNEIFEAYCEAKILDLATRPFLAKVEFTSRPTPSALCESYYKERFFGGDVCADDPRGRNYYNCVWTEGVLRTRFAGRLSVRAASTATGTKTTSPVSLGEFAALPSIRNGLALEDVPFCTASMLRTKILSGVKFKVLANGSITGGFGCGENTRYEISYGSGDWDKELNGTSAGFLIDAVEIKLGSTQLPASFQWLTPEMAAASPELSSAVQSKATKIALFHAGVTGCGSEFNSPNDVYFNDARLAAGLSLQGQCKSMLPPAAGLPGVVVVDEELENERTSLSAMERDLANLKGNACPVSPSCEGVASGHARCDFLNAQVRKAAAAEARGVSSVLVTDFALSFERVTPSSSSVVVWMNNAPVGVGCVGEAKLGACTGTSSGQVLASASPVQAEISAANELVVKMKIDSRQLAAAGVPDSVVRQFAQFDDHLLELNASLNKFETLVPYLSGKAFVRSDVNAKKAVAEGSVSYLIENSLDRTLGEFCSVQ